MELIIGILIIVIGGFAVLVNVLPWILLIVVIVVILLVVSSSIDADNQKNNSPNNPNESLKTKRNSDKTESSTYRVNNLDRSNSNYNPGENIIVYKRMKLQDV